jgi:hypothetical protein
MTGTCICTRGSYGGGVSMMRVHALQWTKLATTMGALETQSWLWRIFLAGMVASVRTSPRSVTGSQRDLLRRAGGQRGSGCNWVILSKRHDTHNNRIPTPQCTVMDGLNPLCRCHGPLEILPEIKLHMLGFPQKQSNTIVAIARSSNVYC